MNRDNQLRHAALMHQVGTFLVALLCWMSLASSALAVITVKVATGNGVPGGTVPLTLSMSREGGEGSVATLNADVIFDTAQLDLVGSCGNGNACRTTADCGQDDYCRFSPTACEKDPRLTDQTVEVTPPDFQNVPQGKRRVRFAIVATRIPVPTFSDGDLVTCTFQIPANAAAGQQTLSTDRLQVADNSIPARPLPSAIVVEAGSIVPGTTGATRTATMSGTPATFTPTAGSPVPTVGSPTATPTSGTPVGNTPTPTATGPVVCPSPRGAPQGPALYVQDLNLNAAGDATISVSLATGGAAVAGAQCDVGSGGSVVVKAAANGRPDCAVNPAINKMGTLFSFRPPACSGEACTAARALVLSVDNVDAIPDGSVLFTCNVTVSGNGGTVPLTGVILSNPTGQRVDGVTSRDGSVCVNSAVSPTATLTGTPTEHGPTPTATATHSSPSPTLTPPTTAVPTATRTSPPPTTRPTATNTAKHGGGGGGGCNVSSGEANGGMSGTWLLVVGALLLGRKRSRR